MRAILIAYCVSLFFYTPLYARIINCTDINRKSAYSIANGPLRLLAPDSIERKAIPKESYFLAQQAEDSGKTESTSLSFVESSEYKCDEGKSLCLSGTVKNNMRTRTLRSVKITVKLYDKDNRLLKTLSVDTVPSDIPAGQEATYEIKTEYDRKIKRYNKSAAWKSRIRR